MIFECESDPDMKWDFDPVTPNVKVHAGETALAFYKVFNRNDKPLIGISVYNISPEYASNYFSKIQCFCFNQQLLNSREELYLPLYFYLEPEITEDMKMEGISQIRVNYKFFACRKQDIALLLQKNAENEILQKNFLMKKRMAKMEEGSEKFLELKKEVEENEIILEGYKGVENEMAEMLKGYNLMEVHTESGVSQLVSNNEPGNSSVAAAYFDPKILFLWVSWLLKNII